MLNSKKKKNLKSLYPGEHYPGEHHSWEHHPWEVGIKFLLTSSCLQPRLLASPVTSGRGPAGSLCFPAAPTGPQEGTDDIIVNPVTKLMVPGPNCTMILPASGHIGPVPPGYFIHPDTGHVLPEAGHLGYDLLSSALIPIADSNAGKTLAHFPALTLFWASEIGRCSLGTSRMSAHTAWLCP